MNTTGVARASPSVTSRCAPAVRLDLRENTEDGKYNEAQKADAGKKRRRTKLRGIASMYNIIRTCKSMVFCSCKPRMSSNVTQLSAIICKRRRRQWGWVG